MCWMHGHRTWRPREARGEMGIVRYADDFVLGFQYRSDAERFLREATQGSPPTDWRCTRTRRA